MASTSLTIDTSGNPHEKGSKEDVLANGEEGEVQAGADTPPQSPGSHGVSSPATSASGAGVPPRNMRARTRSSSLSIKSGGDDDEDELSDASNSNSSTSKEKRAATASESTALRRSIKVVVQKTSDVEQRLPQMINKVGVIVDTPRHPNTWFRVRFSNGKTLTFRASALKPLTDAQADGDEIDLTDIPGNDDLEPQSDEEIGTPDSSNESSSIEVDDRVRVRFGEAIKREAQSLKEYEGKIGVVVECTSSGCVIRLDSVDDLPLIKKKYLRRLNDDDGSATDEDSSKKLDEKSQTTHDEGSDGDNEEEDDEPSEAARRKSKKKDQGTFLSDLDTEMWIGRRVRINVGKYSGQAAIVLRSGNGWVQLKVEDGNENTAKRAYELTLLESMAEIERLAPTKPENNNSKEDEGTDAKDDDMDSGSQEERGSNIGSGGRRRGHYAQSWIERRVFLPGNQGTGIVKKADREVCTVELENANKTIKVFKKQELVLMEDEFSIQQRYRRTNKANAKLNIPDGVILMGITTQRYAMFQDQVKKHVIRRRDKIKNRPNLMEWESILNTQYQMTVSNEEEIVDLFVLPSCTLCGVEKESVDGACWNTSCPRCPVFDVDAQSAKDIPYCRLPKAPLADPLLSLKVQVPEPVATESPTPTDAQSRKRKRQSNDSPVAEEDPKEVIEEQDEEEDSSIPPPPPPPPQDEDEIEDQPSKKLDKHEEIKLEVPVQSPPHQLPPVTTALPSVAAPAFRPQYESVFAKKM